MNINLLIALLALGLSGIYIFFKPQAINMVKQDTEIPLMELHNFTLFEFDTNKLVNFSSGEKAYSYKQRYVLYNFIYNEKTPSQKIVSVTANKGVYQNDTAMLEKNVFYATTDGIEFESQKVFYDKKGGYAKSLTPYKATMQESTAVGERLYYDLKNEKLNSSNVLVNYYLKETKK